MAFMHNTGLYQKYGTEQATATPAGEYKTYGALREIEVKIDLTTLALTPTIFGDVTNFPKTLVIEEVVVETLTAATGATAVLNVGFVRTDRTTEIDFDGVLAAFPLASMDTTGEKTTLTKGSSGAGALVGTSISNPGYITADYDTAAFTAGVIYVRIRYRASV